MVTNIKNDNLFEEISNKVKNDLLQTIEKITPWFFSTLQDFYYEMTPKEEQIEHLHTILSLKQTNIPAATLQSAEGDKVTFISTRQSNQLLIDSLRSLLSTNIRSANIHASQKGDFLAVQTFFTKKIKLDLERAKNVAKVNDIRNFFKDASPEQKENVEKFITAMDFQYFIRYDAARICSHIQFFMEIKDYETVFNLDNERDEYYSRISFCTINPPPTGYLYQIAKILETHKLEVNRMYVNVVEFEPNKEVIFTTVYAIDENKQKINIESSLWQRLVLAIKAIKWIVEDELAQLTKIPERNFTIRKVHFIRAASVFVHQFLSKIQRERYTYKVVKKAFLSHPDISELLADYFYIRFNPNTEDICLRCGTESDKRLKQIEEVLGKLHLKINALMRVVEKQVFNTCIRFIDNILKTNYFIEDSIGLAFRMDPQFLDKKTYQPQPFGFFFFFGRGYKGYHIRFQDMARGGLRIVRSRDKEHFDHESTRVFDEVFSLSSAQQLKNKDIPEGGSKGILLLYPDSDLKQSVECAIDSLLDLIVTDKQEKLNSRVVDYYKKEEIIYLGPDENVTDERINWIVQRAKQRKYKYPNAFMSSKPGVGINHKEYGVTSHGVNVYVEECLRHLKIDPKKDPFTVRIIGGPDGDVAGNEMKILVSSYPKVKIVAISDGGGAAYDVEGLNHDEIMRLVKESKTIVDFDPKFLSDSSENFVVNANTIDGRKIRDELQVSNRVKSDLLIPAGGRPNTIHVDNWHKSLDEHDKPVFRAIVEGANIFLTNDARYKLEEKGVIIIKDSSANKGGVICSSYEIIASLILTEQEFLEIKPQYVKEVISILKEKALMESKLLFREHRLKKIPFTKLSGEISAEINELTDILKPFIRKDIEENTSERYSNLLKAHCPPILVEKYYNRILEQIPYEHRLSILATQVASRIVYKEGLGWVKSLNHTDVPKIIDIYLEQDSVVIDYIRKILDSDLPGKETIAKILDRNARKELTREALLEN